MVRIKKKKLIPPHIGQNLESLSPKPIYGRKSYQVFCPKCKFGPIFTAELTTVCGICNSELYLKRMPDGEYMVTTVK
jgi:hypothetical protein